MGLAHIDSIDLRGTGKTKAGYMDIGKVIEKCSMGRLDGVGWKEGRKGL